METAILRPWRFDIRIGGEPRGLLKKRWSGLSKELFTDADNFLLDRKGVTDARIRVLTCAATVLIDVVHFERAQRCGSSADLVPLAALDHYGSPGTKRATRYSDVRAVM